MASRLPAGTATCHAPQPSYHDETFCSFDSAIMIVLDDPSRIDLIAIPLLDWVLGGMRTPLGNSLICGLLNRFVSFGFNMQPKCVAHIAFGKGIVIRLMVGNSPVDSA